MKRNHISGELLRAPLRKGAFLPILCFFSFSLLTTPLLLWILPKRAAGWAITRDLGIVYVHKYRGGNLRLVQQGER